MKKTVSDLMHFKHADYLYAVFRVVVGVLFFVHGLQKFGVGTERAAATFGTLMWFAGTGELLIGLGLAFGVLVRLAAAFGVIQMLVAYGVHSSGSGLNPFVNRGELALMYLLAFLVMVAYGARVMSLEKSVFGKEVF